jgi:hypothetical protein
MGVDGLIGPLQRCPSRFWSNGSSAFFSPVNYAHILRQESAVIAPIYSPLPQCLPNRSPRPSDLPLLAALLPVDSISHLLPLPTMSLNLGRAPPAGAGFVSYAGGTHEDLTAAVTGGRRSCCARPLCLDKANGHRLLPQLMVTASSLQRLRYPRRR